MRIVHYHREIRLVQGGVVRAVLDLSGSLADEGHDVVLVTADDSDVPDAWKAGGPGLPTVIRVPNPVPIPGFATPPFRRAMTSALDAADLVHLHGMWTPENVTIARIARRLGVPYVLSPHGMLDDWGMSVRTFKKSTFLTLFGRRMLRDAAAIHLCGEAEFQQASRRLPRDNGVAIPLLMDLSEYRERPSGDADSGAGHGSSDEAGDRDEEQVVFLSRLHPKKSLEVLIDAMSIVARNRPHAVLVIAGTGEPAYERMLRARAESSGLGDRCRFVGFVSGIDKTRLLARSDLFVLPTLHENFGFVLLESLAAGTPTLATPEAGIAKEIEQAGAGRTVDRDANSIANEITALLSDRRRLAEMGERGRAWVFEEFDKARGVAKFADLYRSLR